MSDEKVTIKKASEILNVDTRTIYRWIGKDILSKVKCGGKSYVLMADVKALLDDNLTVGVGDVQSSKTGFDIKSDIVKVYDNHYIVDKNHYEGLLVKLGQLENEKRYLLEYKEGLEQKDRLVQETEAENKRLKSRSLWQRIFNKF